MIDNLLVAIKHFTTDMKLLQYLSGRLKTYCSELLPPVPPPCPVVPPQCALVSAGCPLSWRMAVCTQPIYLIGRLDGTKEPRYSMQEISILAGHVHMYTSSSLIATCLTGVVPIHSQNL